MEVKEALAARRSVRKFTEESVSDEQVLALLHAAMSGPSAVNATPWEFYVVRGAERLEALRGCTHYSKIKAPLAIVVCGNLTRALPLGLAEFWVQDTSAATENILLEAVDLGLGAVWCGVYPQKASVKKVREALGLPLTQVPLNIIYLGHPAETPSPRDQYQEKYVHYLD